MDSHSQHPGEFDPYSSSEVAADPDVSAAIGTDERRMHVRAYNYWVSLLDGRDYPSIEDLEPADVEDFKANSILLDFTAGRDNPATPFIGTAIRDECDLAQGIRTIADVPSRSLLSRLTDHYMQIIANRAPVGFEAEFVNQRSATICYRGILMPFSSDGDTIDFIYGVINWKRGDGTAVATRAAIAPNIAPVVEEHSADALSAADGDEFVDVAEFVVDAEAGLADQLCAARECAEAVKSADHRTRAALYRALSQAYDFALAALAAPADYAELLDDSGVKAQARAPMTPVVKLVFGIDYDKTRLTEFASALSFAQRNAVANGEFLGFIEGHSGGLKGIVAAERQARRPRKADSKMEAARDSLRALPPFAMDHLPAEEEFCLVITRRSADGRHEAIASVTDASLLDRAIRRAVS